MASKLSGMHLEHGKTQPKGAREPIVIAETLGEEPATQAV